MASEYAQQKAAQLWCKPSTSHIEMNNVLCEAIAEEIEYLTSIPWLGNATTRQLLDEVRARIETDGMMDYRTVDGEHYDRSVRVIGGPPVN